MKMIATREMRYQGRTLNPGDEFEPSDVHAKVFRVLGKAEDAPEKKAAAKKAPEPAVEAVEDAAPVKTRAMKAEAEVEAQDVPAPKSTGKAAAKKAAAKGTYSRRDMRAAR